MLKLKLNTLATWCKELTHLKRPWYWERVKVGEGDDKGWDSWRASPTQWIWVWVNSRSWWWIGRPGVPRSMGSKSQTWLSSWTELNVSLYLVIFFALKFTFIWQTFICHIWFSFWFWYFFVLLKIVLFLAALGLCCWVLTLSIFDLQALEHVGFNNCGTQA